MIRSCAPVSSRRNGSARRALTAESHAPRLIPEFDFIDLCAGIGGFRIALDQLGGRCVYTSEWDRFCAQTYDKWFGARPDTRDIDTVDPSEIRKHDLLAAGFPCQPFSLAGVSKKQSLGHKHGFECEKQGHLFFSIMKIARFHQPRAMILENVKNLKTHDGGQTWRVILSELDNIGYTVRHRIIDAADYVPQHRERIIIACFRDVADAEKFSFPDPPKKQAPPFRSILEDKPDAKYILTDHLWDYLQKYAAKHRAAGNGFGFGMTDLDGISRTLSARYHKDGSEVLIPRRRTDPRPSDRRRCNPRRLSPVEAARLMGFESKVQSSADIHVSDTQAYRQFGNAVVPAVVKAVAEQMLKVLQWPENQPAPQRGTAGKKRQPQAIPA